MANERKYYEQMNIDIEMKIREILKELPPFCKEYFIGMESSTQARTRLAYAYDLGVFFHFLHDNNPVCQKMEIREFPLTLLEQITPMDIEEYLYQIRFYKKDGSEHTNEERGVSRKLASLRSFYNYFFRKQLIEKNPAELVKMPKIHEKNIIRLDVDEVAKFLDEVDSGESLTERQKRFHKQTRTRDLAMMTLLLGTGIRVSECVGLDIEDVDLNNDGIKVHRKGGAETIVYFGEEVREALLPYLEEREQMVAADGSTNALFLSLQRKRINVRSVQLMVKKYAQLVTSLKKITPHKLRSTYGTSLYRETGDIYLVADVLGHKDVNTTRKHYAAQEEDRRRAAAKYVHLRRD